VVPDVLPGALVATDRTEQPVRMRDRADVANKQRTRRMGIVSKF